MSRKRIFIVTGLGFGDEGKGTITDALARRYNIDTVVRYNGGPQAGHNVFDHRGRGHCFAQFGSGTLVEDVKTFLSREMLIEPENLLREADALARLGVADPLQRLTIDADAWVVTPMHKMVNQLKELARGTSRHGSCGMGVGETVFDKEKGLGIRIRDMLDGPTLIRKVQELQEAKFSQAFALYSAYPSEEMRERIRYFEERCWLSGLLAAYRGFLARLGVERIDADGTHLSELVSRGVSLVFEGAQGALLDRTKGFVPHVTKTRATWHNAGELLAETDPKALAAYEVKKLGVTRAYATRHGAGPFVTGNEDLTHTLLDPRNPENEWQGMLRSGWLDLVMLRYAVAINDGIDALAVTGLDWVDELVECKVYTSYTDGKKRITRLKPGSGEAEQREVTALLERAEPQDFFVVDGPDALLQHLERALRAPVLVASYGPGSDDKSFTA